jgi:eukaryotic-like serine/threonine-protein kinase
MGLVYRARDTVLNRTVALKILPPEFTHNTEFMYRIRTEAYAQARLHHPNIVTLFSVLEVPAGFVLVLEHVEGETLHQRIQRTGPLEAAEAVSIYEQALRGVVFAHAAGIVHRDLKPDNIFITDQNEVKLMDFGVAKIMDSKEPTRARSMVGTLLYISPEQINGRDADPRSDIYTLGIGLFETVTGRLPFERKTDFSLMHAHMLEEPPRPRTLQRDLPRELETVILKAIEKDPARRFQNAGEFRAALVKQCRRHGLALPAANGTESETDSSWRARLQSWRGRTFGNLGLDLLLLIVASALALSLGLYPTPTRPPDEVAPVTRLATPKVRTFTATTKAQQEAVRTENERPGREDKAAEQKRYDSLRKAWGG